MMFVSTAMLADSVLMLHVAVVLFVVVGLPLIGLGNMAGWRWVNDWWFRLTHLLAIAIVRGLTDRIEPPTEQNVTV